MMNHIPPSTAVHVNIGRRLSFIKDVCLSVFDCCLFPAAPVFCLFSSLLGWFVVVAVVFCYVLLFFCSLFGMCVCVCARACVCVCACVRACVVVLPRTSV